MDRLSLWVGAIDLVARENPATLSWSDPESAHRWFLENRSAVVTALQSRPQAEYLPRFLDTKVDPFELRPGVRVKRAGGEFVVTAELTEGYDLDNWIAHDPKPWHEWRDAHADVEDRMATPPTR